MVLRLLVDVPMDVPIQQLGGRVERVVNAAMISLRDEESHNVGERGYMVSSGVAENTLEHFFPSRDGGWQWSLSKFHL